MKKSLIFLAMSCFFNISLLAQEEDVTHYIQNAGFDDDLTFQKDGTMKEKASQQSLSDRSWAFIAADSTVYARPKETSSQSRTDGRKLDAVNGFAGRINGWKYIGADFPKCEWTYFGSVAYDLDDTAVPIADDGTTYLSVPARPQNEEFEAGEGFLFFRAGWGGKAIYKQEVNLPPARYRLEYWTININPNTTSVATDLTQITCRRDVFKDEEGTGLQNQEWTKHEFEFDATASFTMQFGYQAANAGSGGQPIVGLDGIKLYKIGEVDPEELINADLNAMVDSLLEQSIIAEDAGMKGLADEIYGYSQDLSNIIDNGTLGQKEAAVLEAKAKTILFGRAFRYACQFDAFNDRLNSILQYSTVDYAYVQGLMRRLADGYQNGSSAQIIELANEAVKLIDAYQTEQGTRNVVTIPNLEFMSGSVVTIPVSAETTREYVAFQMDIYLPYGATPVADESGTIVITKNNSRLADSHIITYTYVPGSNLLRVFCNSLDNEVISDVQGELFSLQLNTNNMSGYYEYSVRNIKFSTASGNGVDAQGYSFSNVYATLTAQQIGDKTYLLTEISYAEDELNNLSYPNSAPANDVRTLLEEARQAAEGTLMQTEIDLLLTQIWTAMEEAFNADEAYRNLDAIVNDLTTAIANHPDADENTIAEANRLLEQAQNVLAEQKYYSQSVLQVYNQIQSCIIELNKVYLTINVTNAGTLNTLVTEIVGNNYNSVTGITVTGTMNSNDFSFITRSLTSATSMDFSDTDVKEIPSGAFSKRRNLQSVVLPKELITIGSRAFENCSNLNSLMFPATLKTLGTNAFYNCDQLYSIELPEGFETLKNSAFSDCDNLSEVILPSTTVVVEGAFCNCWNLSQITCKAVVPPTTNGYDVMCGNEGNCILYVPNFVVDTYRNTEYWWNFNIEAGDFVVDYFVFTDEYWLNSDDEMFTENKASITITRKDRYGYWEPERYQYGSLYVEGEQILSLNNFQIAYDPYFQWMRKNYGYWGGRASGVLVNNAQMRADNVAIDLRLRAYVWNFISLPFDVKVGDIEWTSNDQLYAIYKYDGKKRAELDMDNTWVRMTADSTLRAGVGYIWQVASNYADGKDSYEISCIVRAQDNGNKNNIFRNGNVKVALNEYLSEYPQDRSWNLLGNPYPSYFYSRDMNIEAPFTVWNNYSQNYEAYSPLDDDYTFAPGEAFFFQRPVNQETIIFFKDGRWTEGLNSRSADFAEARRSSSTTPRYVYNLTLTGNEQSDRTRFVISEKATLGYELDKDASKFASINENAIQLYTIEQEVRYAINERPLSIGEVALGMTITQKGEYTLKLETVVEGEVYVLDRLTGVETLMDENGYTFESEAGTFDGRFIIRLVSGETTGITNVNNSASEKSYYRLNGLRVQKPQKGLYIEHGKKVVVK